MVLGSQFWRAWTLQCNLGLHLSEAKKKTSVFFHPSSSARCESISFTVKAGSSWITVAGTFFFFLRFEQKIMMICSVWRRWNLVLRWNKAYIRPCSVRVVSLFSVEGPPVCLPCWSHGAVWKSNWFSWCNSAKKAWLMAKAKRKEKLSLCFQDLLRCLLQSMLFLFSFFKGIVRGMHFLHL